MTRRQSIIFGLIVALVCIAGFAAIVLKPDTGNITGSAVETRQGIDKADAACRNHNECPVGHVCKLGECLPVERSFCSQDVVLAQSLEGRFIRYTTCTTRCVRSGDSAFCE